ncbi:glycosyltransferase family 1 protein [uncultured Aquimarina sp.]|uniref:glycosyltransferase family 1 protein n=1 Tax=uncultured Aquimarina sp. TaxID=575652 RepID=UPI002635FBD7|nr:glycosyltransferase family 1 protein [uncultured Aquimarina sp.]
MSAIRVLQVFTIMNRGGAESMIMNYYRNMDRTKIQFDFLVHRKQSAAFDQEITDLGGKIYRFDPINPLFPGSYYKNLRLFFKEHSEYKIIHSHLNTFSYFPLKVAKEFGVPCRIAHAHIALEKIKFSNIFSGGEGLKETLKSIIKIWLKRRIHKPTTHNFTCGDKAGIWLFGSDTNHTTMNNAVDAEKFIFNEETRASYRKEFNFENQLVIGHVGSFTKQKNHSYLLKIFSELLQSYPQSKLILIGGGPLKESIKSEAVELGIQGDVKFLGVREDIPQLIQMLDFFVFPSFYEGLPVTLIEAQSAGLKIIASDTITEEVLLTDDIKFLSIKENPSFWVKPILDLKNYERKNNLDIIKDKKYDIKQNVKEIEKFYLQQLN